MDLNNSQNHFLPDEIARSIPRLLHDAHQDFLSGTYANAIARCKQVLLIVPLHMAAHKLLGMIHDAQGDIEASLRHFRIALSIAPNDTSLLYNCATVLQKAGKVSEALRYYEQALSIDPTHCAAANNCCSLHLLIGNLDEAERLARHIVASDPHTHLPWVNLCAILRDAGRFEESLECLRKALELNPDSIEAWSHYLLTLHYLPDFDPRFIYEEHRRFESTLRKQPPQTLHGSWNHSKTRVGYISPDFRLHSVSFFIEPILVNHDRNQFDIFCYNDHHGSDLVTTRLRSLKVHWRDCAGQSNDDLRSRIIQDQIDILVDLGGHTATHRMPLFFDRIAPVQVTYLGYPNTTGISTMDVRLTDSWADPANTESLCTEQLVRMPEGFLCYQPPEAPEVSILPALERGCVTFGCFNNLPKINKSLLELWAKILHAVPGSCLFLKSRQLGCESVRRRIVANFGQYGIEQNRIVLRGPAASISEHLASYAGIDIALDTFPYQGTTTTCEALLMGIPVVTLAGTSHASRVGVSILSQIGLTGMVARTADEYVNIAKHLARNMQQLVKLRFALRPALLASSLCNGAAFTLGLESCYSQLIAKAREGFRQ